MKWLWLVATLFVIGANLAHCQDNFDDEDVLIDEDFDDVEEEAEQPELKIPKKEKPVYAPPQVQGSVHFAEAFVSQDSYAKRWTVSQAMKDDTDEDIAKYDGQWKVEEPSENPLQGDLMLVLKSKAKHHAVSAKLDKPFMFSGKPLVVQYEVKFQNGQECGGAYIKLLSHDAKFDLKQFTDKTPYTIMFGPDKCGNDEKLHFIFRHKNPKTGEYEEKHAKKPASSVISHVFTDKKTHLFKLVINPDSTFEVYVDQEMSHSGSLLSDVSPPVNPPAEIEDKDDKKPEDWDEREKIADPDAEKPEDWDEDEPEYITDETATMPDGWLEDEDELIPDPDAERPGDWDDDMDGEWEAPMITNPACESAAGCGEWKAPQIKNPKYKGKWRAPKIDNPNYKGKWKPRMIANPDYFEDLEPYKMTPIGAVGLELWSMSDEIAFDNFLVTDDMLVADKWAEDSFEIKQTQELDEPTGQSVVDAVLDMTNERPWLWAVILVVVVLPVILVVAYCCSGGSSKPADEAAQRKKTDAATPDDKRSDAEASTEEEDEAKEDGGGDAEPKATKGSPKKSPKASPKKAGAAKKPSKSDLETEEDQADDDADAEEEEAEDEKPATRSSPRKRSTRARKD